MIGIFWAGVLALPATSCSGGGSTVPHSLAPCCSCPQVRSRALGEAPKAILPSWWQCWAGEELQWCEPRDNFIPQCEPCDSCLAIVRLFLSCAGKPAGFCPGFRLNYVGGCNRWNFWSMFLRSWKKERGWWGQIWCRKGHKELSCSSKLSLFLLYHAVSCFSSFLSTWSCCHSL